MKGSETTVAARSNKLIVTSLREVAAGNVGYDDTMSMNDMILEIESNLNK